MAFHLNAMIDAPCGAMAWQTPLLNHLVHTKPGFRYLGIDVVKHVVQKNSNRFSGAWTFYKNISKSVNPGFSVAFLHADLANTSNWSMPLGYDLILCRDALQHLRYDDIWRVLHRFADSDAKYILIGSYPEGSMHCAPYMDGSPNRNLARPGAFFCIDLQRPPFRLMPTDIFKEGTVDRKTLLLFERKALRRQLHNQYT